MEQQLEIIDDIRTLLAYHHSLGIEVYPHDAGIPQFRTSKAVPDVAGGTLPQSQRSGTAAHPVASVAHSTPQAIPAAPLAPAPEATETLSEIITDINVCRNCRLHTQRAVPVPGHGAPRARLLIVGTWLSVPEQASFPPNTIFGLEEDQMLARMLAAIHLSADDIFVTNSIKCGIKCDAQGGPPASSQPMTADAQRCLTYLRRQISVIAPEVICTMGILATRALLELPQSLSQLRGRFHQFTTLEGRQIPLIPTYHPSYLIQAPEMKRQTWEDLQLIESKLGAVKR